jgi:hypothetical protein
MTSEEDMTSLMTAIDRCKVDEFFSGKRLETELIEAVTQRRHRRFHAIVNRQLAVARANERAQAQAAPEPEASVTSTTMKRVTFERLIAPRPQTVADETEEFAQVSISGASKRILRKSQRRKELQSLPLEERSRMLATMREDAIRKMGMELEQEELALMQQPAKLGDLPGFYDHLPDDVRHRSAKEEAPIESWFKPKIIPYDDYRRQKARSSTKQVTPVGWENSVQRMRLARLERNEIQEALDPRSGPMKSLNRGRYAEWKKSKSSSNAPEQNPSSEAVDSVLGI